ncbi:nitrilase-related carbon-nitrogen hydrolase, partial [Colibacter massiliensis]
MLKIGLAQFSVQPGNAEANTEKMKQYIERAKKSKCHLIIFPELAIPGYFIGDNWDQPDYTAECIRCGEEIRALSDDITVIYGNVAIEADKTNPDGRPRKYNAMFIAQKGKFISPGRSPYPFYIKTLLPNYREFNDLRHFTSLTEVAQERHVFPEDFLSPVKLDFGPAGTLTVGPLICEDSWDENYAFKPMTCLSDMYDLDMFINISNSPFTLGKTERRNRLFKKAVGKFNRPVIYVNCTGIQNNGKNIYTFDGTSGVYDKTGSLCRSCPSFEENLTFVIYEGESRSFTDTFPPACTEKNETAEIFTSLQYGIRSFLEQIGMKKVV